MSKVVAIIRILKTCCYLHDTLGNQLRNGVYEKLFVAPLWNERGKFVEQTTFFGNLGKRSQTT